MDAPTLDAVAVWPTHLDLPFDDGRPVPNLFEFPQCALLIGAAIAVFNRLHPDGRYCVGQNSFVYYDYDDPPLMGWRAPDVFYVPDVDSNRDDYRRSFVIRDEGGRRPKLVIEIASDTGREERDATPLTGKFWAYEQGIKAEYYAIYIPDTLEMELYELGPEGRYRRVECDERGLLPVNDLGLNLGRWEGTFMGRTGWWMRFYDEFGELLLTGDERAEEQRLRAEEQQRLAEEQRRRAEEQQRQAEEQRRRAEEQKRLAEEQLLRAEEQQRLAEEQRLRAEEQQRQAEEQRRRAEAADARAVLAADLARAAAERAASETASRERLVAILRAHGIDPDAPPT